MKLSYVTRLFSSPGSNNRAENATSTVSQKTRGLFRRNRSRSAGAGAGAVVQTLPEVPVPEDATTGPHTLELASRRRRKSSGGSSGGSEVEEDIEEEEEEALESGPSSPTAGSLDSGVGGAVGGGGASVATLAVVVPPAPQQTKTTFLMQKLTQYKAAQAEQNKRKVTEKELAQLNHKIATVPPASESQVITRQGKCYAGINEVHVSDTKFFVEIIRTCSGKGGVRKNSPLRWYKLAILQDDPARLIAVVDLSDTALGFGIGESLHVFGTCNDMSFVSNANVSSVQSSVRPELKLKVGVNYVILLTFNSFLDEFRKVKLNGFLGIYDDRKLDDMPPIDRVLSANLVDLVFFCLGSKCRSVSNRLIRWIQDTERQLGIAIPNVPVALPTSYSLNRCEILSINTVGRYRDFRYSQPSPGTPNDCSGDRAKSCSSSIEEASSSSQSTPSRLATSEDYLGLLRCGIKGGSTLLEEASEFKRPTLKFVREQQRSVLVSEAPPAVEYELCRDVFPNNGQIMDRVWVKSWLKVSFHNNSCNFYCSSCRKFFSLKLRQDYKAFDNFQNEKGYTPKRSPSENLRLVLLHEKKQIHTLAHRFASDIEARGGTVDASMKAINVYERAESVLYKSTQNLLKLQLTEVVAGNSYSDHYLFFNLLKELEADIGMHHFSRSGATTMVQSLSLSFRKILLHYLVNNVQEFSFIVDASTDISNKGVLACLIQALEGAETKVYYYRVIELVIGESAENLFQAIEEQVENDNYVQEGFEDFFWNKLSGFVSDNAAVMIGKENSLYTRLNERASQNVILIGCMAHKLQLSIQRAIKDNTDDSLDYFKTFDKKCSEFYTYYMSWGSKRVIHLQETAEEYEFEYVRLKKFFEVRWASSYHAVIAALKTNFYLMRQDLAIMAADSTLSKSTREGAQSLYELTCDKTFIVVLHEYMDFLTVFKGISLSLQSAGGILVGKYDLINNGIQSFESLKSTPGKELAGFLATCTCSICKLGDCTIDLYDRCKAPKCNNLAFKATSDSLDSISVKRKVLYEKFISKTMSYFDLQNLAAMDIFNPVVLKAGSPTFNVQNVPNGENKLSTICQFFHLSEFYGECFEFKLEYSDLLLNVAFANASVSDITNPFEFIHALLKAADQNGKVAKILRVILILPAGSSDAERVFSMLNRAKTKDKSRLLVNHLDSILRLQFNVPKDLFGIDWYFLAREFVRTHIRSDDADWKGGRPKTALEVNSVYESSLF